MFRNIFGTLVIPILAALIYSTVQCFLKAYLSKKFGDITESTSSRITLNPIAHLDPVGMMLFLLKGFGFSKPVDINVLRYKNKKLDVVIVCFVPLIVIFLLGLGISSLASNIDTYMGVYTVYLGRMLQNTAIFNLIPIYPLEGNRVLKIFLSPDTLIKYINNEKKLQIVMIFLIIWYF